MPELKNICIVDDDAEIRQLLSEYLREHGYDTVSARDAASFFHIFEKLHCDLVVLDIMLPGEDGFAICRRLRAQSQVPVIFLTALGELTDRVVGLELGADDYLGKPFEPRELLARIRTVLRRSETRHPNEVGGASAEPSLHFAGWTLDATARHLLSPEGVVVSLSGAEYRLLRVFLTHPQTVLSREQLLEYTQGPNAAAFDRSIDVQISRLRTRLRDNSREAGLIKTVRGDGYVLAADVRPLGAA